MKRSILCQNCAKELSKLFPTQEPYPGEFIKFVKGGALKQYKCNDCNKNIGKHEDCYAMSIWSDRVDYSYYPWEFDYISPTKPEPEIKTKGGKKYGRKRRKSI